MMSLLLPIPAERISQTLHFIPFKVDTGYTNFKCTLKLRASDSIGIMR